MDADRLPTQGPAATCRCRMDQAWRRTRDPPHPCISSCRRRDWSRFWVGADDRSFALGACRNQV